MRLSSRLLVLFSALLGTRAALAEPAAGTRGMVATASPIASAAGVEILRAGGNAADAAAAAAFTLAVVEPYSSGIGGGGFALVRAGTDVRFLDFREVAPRAARRDMFVRDGQPAPELSRDGPLAVAVPGAVAGYLALTERFGKLSRARVLAPAIRAAEQGFLVDERYRGYVASRLELLRRDPEAARIFLVAGAANGQAEAPPLGYRIRQPQLARTLRVIARDGAAAFYTGEIAARLAADMRARGGLVTAADLAAYRVRERVPLVGSFLGMAVATAPPPSAGGEVLLTILNVMETQRLRRRWHEPRLLELFIEASKRAFADRALLGDPAFVPDVTDLLVSKARARLLADQILAADHATPAAAVPPGVGAPLPPPEARVAPVVKLEEGTDTTHLCVVDAQGDAVSLTTTVNYGWGAGIVARGTGMLWNDEMDDFAIAPGVPNVYGVAGAQANAVAPGKVPLSSMTPTIVFAGATLGSPVRLVVGSPGGPRIPTTVAQIILNHLAYGADVERAVALGRLHHQHLPDEVFVEPFTLDPRTRRWLRKRGQILVTDGPWSNATAIAVDPATGVRTGAADPRGGGAAMAE